MKSILLFLFLGSAFALQPGFRYRYKYVGLVQTGIPEYSTTGTSTGITAFIEVEPRSDGYAYFELTNVKYGVSQGCLGCNMRDIKTNEFQPISDRFLKRQMEQGFLVNLFNGRDPTCISTQRKEKLWLTNFRRGVVNSFRGVLNRMNFDRVTESPLITEFMSHGKIPHVFSTVEETIYGNCEVEYSVHPFFSFMNGAKSAELEKNQEKDVQRGAPSKLKTGGKKTGKKTGRKTGRKIGKFQSGVKQIDEQLYHVTTTVNFDKCEENVYLQVSSGGSFFKPGGSTSDWLGGRSSIGEYIFRGKPGSFRLEEAILEGGYSTNALGFTNQYMHAGTNQTITLVSVTKADKNSDFSNFGTTVNGLMFGLNSPFGQPKNSKQVPWVTYQNDDDASPFNVLLGLKMSSEEVQAYKEKIIGIIKEAAVIMTAEKAEDANKETGYVMNNLQLAKRLIEILPKAVLEEICNNIFSRDPYRPNEILQQKLLLDLFIASGSRAGYQVVLDVLKQQNIGSLQKLFIAATIRPPLLDVRVLPDLIDYAVGIDLSKDHIVGPTFLLNVASIIKRFCVDTEATTSNYAGKLYGDETCNVDAIQEKFIPYINKIINDEKKTWERIVAIKALHSSGISSSIQILGPVALGLKGTNEFLRTTAVYAISRWTLPLESRDAALQVLSQIHTNTVEMPRVRNAALLMATSWGPDPGFYYRIAKLSWREPSASVAAFYSSIVENTAKTQHPIFKTQNQAARQALRFIKPVPPSFKTPSYVNMFSADYEARLMHLHEQGFSYYNYPEPFSNLDAYVFDMVVANKHRVITLSSLLSMGAMGGLKKNAFFSTKDQGHERRYVENPYTRLQSEIGAEPPAERDDVIVTLQTSLLDSLNVLLTYSKEAQIKSGFDTVYMASILVELQTGLNRVLGKFFVVATHRMFSPNDMGLPVLATHDGLMAMVSHSSSRLNVGSGSESLELPKKFELTVDNYMRSYSQSSSELHIFVPWIKAGISTAVSVNNEAAAPILTSINFDSTENSQHPLLTFTFENAYDHEYSVIRSKTVPSVRILPLAFTEKKAVVQPQIRVIKNHGDFENTVKLPNKFTGLDFTINYESQLRYPFDFFGLKKQFTEFVKNNGMLLFSGLSSQTVDYSSLDIKFNPKTSETKKITFKYAIKTSKDSELDDITQQTGQTTGNDYNDYGQQSGQTYSKDYNDYGQQQSFRKQDAESFIDINDSYQKKSEKISEHVGKNVDSISLSTEFIGKRSRQYELMFSWTKPAYINDRQKRKFHMALLFNGIPKQQLNSVCMDIVITSPTFSSLTTYPEVLQKTNLDTHIVRKIYLNCKGEAALSADYQLKLTKQRIERIKKDIPIDCDFDQFDPMNTFYKYAIYDDIFTKITLNEELSDPEFKLNDMISLKLNPSRQMEVSWRKCPVTDTWDFKVDRSGKEYQVEGIAVNKVMEILASVNLYAHTRQEDINENHLPSDKCVVQEDSVRTFDGVIYNYEPTECWTVAAKDCSSDGWLVLVKKASTESPVPEIRVLDRVNALNIDKNVLQRAEDGVTKYRGDRGRTSKVTSPAIIRKQGTSVSVELPHRVIVSVTKDVKIKVHNFAGSVCGICGRNFEKMAGFHGPKHRVYTDPQLFFTSWTGSGDSCIVSYDKRRQVSNYQRSYPAVYDLFFNQEGHYNQYNMGYVYVIEKKGEYNCVTSRSLPRCADRHSPVPGSKKYVNTYLRCYSKTQTPRSLQAAINKGQDFMKYYLRYQAHKVLPTSIEIQTSCL